MNYQKIHDAIIERAKIRQIESPILEYKETHHIVPKSMGGRDDADNLVNLTAKEHFVIHHLLWKIHRNKQMAYAFFFMVYGGSKKHTRSHIISARNFETARRIKSETNKLIKILWEDETKLNNITIHDLISKSLITTLEIAKLTGKEHRSVIRDCNNMFSQLGINYSSNLMKVQKNHQNQTISVYCLDRKYALCLIGGYSAKYMLAIAERFTALEKSCCEKIQDYSDVDTWNAIKKEIESTFQKPILCLK